MEPFLNPPWFAPTHRLRDPNQHFVSHQAERGLMNSMDYRGGAMGETLSATVECRKYPIFVYSKDATIYTGEILLPQNMLCASHTHCPHTTPVNPKGASEWRLQVSVRDRGRELINWLAGDLVLACLSMLTTVSSFFSLSLP